jgi:hypothetical protein
MKTRAWIVKGYRSLSFFASDPFQIMRFRKLVRFMSELRKFKNGNNLDLTIFPVLSDYDADAGVMSGHYFHQDLFVANRVYLARPKRHVDVGSRIDGFVAHVASFREIEIVDIRDLTSSSKNISFRRGDLMTSSDIRTDSLSCLHTIEHFGLGRYGDPINPIGHLVGFSNLVSMVTEGGSLYISFPISSFERVEFNAHRVFAPESIFSWPGSEMLKLENFAYVDDSGDLHSNSTPLEAREAELLYGCGIYEFKKIVDIENV